MDVANRVILDLDFNDPSEPDSGFQCCLKNRTNMFGF